MSKVDQLKRHIQTLEGFLIGNTHFKIGSKVHSSDFFYAKRLFQNSYYTARIALLLSIKIKEKFEDPEKSLTLVGYEFYSELLLSLIKMFLNNSGYKNINHFITIDLDEKIKHIPDNIRPYDNIAIIVPIASTGSTAIKIEGYVRSIHKGNNPVFIFNHYNILLAIDESKNFNLITSLTKAQQSLIKLKATWQNPSDCEWCFNNLESRPLFETDKSSLTPALIFGLPSAKSITNKSTMDFDDVNFLNALIYRRAKRNNEHFLFSTNTEILIKDNKDPINFWLQNLQKELNIKLTDKVVIISPCHYSNTMFINLVNDIIFNSSATIIHHQTDVGYLANFKLLNQKHLEQKDAKIFFVDDSLISGKTFFNIYDLYRYTLDYSKDLSGAIFLSNKSSPDIHKRVSRAVKENIYSFINVNLPIPPKVFDRKPLEHEIKRYTNLSQFALHDVLKKEFYDKSKDLNGENPDLFEVNETNKDKKERHLKMFKATHTLYEFFGGFSDIQAISFNNILKNCGFDNNKIEDKMALMKVLSQYPFLLYRPLREKTFKWHKEWFNLKIERISKELTMGLANQSPSYLFTYDDFRELKFLIRRSVFLGNYKVLSKDFFDLVKLVFDQINKINGQKDLFNLTIENADSESKKENLEDFHLFLLKQYVELIEKNGWCAVKIIENIKNIENDFNTQQGNQFVRMLKIETASIFNDFYSILNANKEWLELFKYKMNDGSCKNITEEDEIVLDDENIRIKLFLSDDKKGILNSNKFEISNRVLGLKDGDDFKKQVLNYFWIKQFLNSDQKSKTIDIPLTDKTEAIFQKLKRLFNDSIKIGAFFIVTDGKSNPHLVYDKDSGDYRFIKELNEDKHDILLKFLIGESDGQNIDNKTIIEYENRGNNQWIDLYNLKSILTIKSFVNDCKWLLMIRISDSDFKTLGLIGFYCRDVVQNDLLAKQLLMLLRKDISLFIKKHHRNDEFSSLREAEATKRYAYLAGHGRQMIQKLSRENNDIFGDVVATMEKLQYLFATKLVSPYGNSRNTKEEANRNLLRNVFSDSKLDLHVLNEIIDMGNEIYKTNIIENYVEMEKELSHLTDDKFSFSFNSKILTFICFELFVNAKKNRFHFISGPCSSCSTDKNKLEIIFEIINNNLIVILKGTGTLVPQDVIEEINGGTADVKREYEISGLNLINKVIKILNIQNTLSIDCIEYKPCCGIYENTLKIKLIPIDNG